MKRLPSDVTRWVRPISSNIYVPAIPTVADAFGVSSEDVNLTVTVYL